MKCPRGGFECSSSFKKQFYRPQDIGFAYVIGTNNNGIGEELKFNFLERPIVMYPHSLDNHDYTTLTLSGKLPWAADGGIFCSLHLLFLFFQNLHNACGLVPG
jgi:hypothetical protein